MMLLSCCMLALVACSGAREGVEEIPTVDAGQLEAAKTEAEAELAREWFNSQPLADEETRDYRGCEADDDCVYVNNGCCDCVNGGRDLAIHRDRVEEFRALFQCSGRCTMVGQLVPCGSGKVSCQHGLCVYERPPPVSPLPVESGG